jgi:hypothetical protein
VTGADLNAVEEGLLAQMAALKPPVMRLVATLGRVDGWLTMWVNGAGLRRRPEPAPEPESDRAPEPDRDLERLGGPPLTAQRSL